MLRCSFPHYIAAFSTVTRSLHLSTFSSSTVYRYSVRSGPVNTGDVLPLADPAGLVQRDPPAENGMQQQQKQSEKVDLGARLT